ncbi:MAG: hypothetical protein AAGE94_18450 [Acidobacteriota bacterium]
MQTLMPFVAAALVLEVAVLIAVLYALYLKACQIRDTTIEIAEAVTAPGHTGLPWTESRDDQGDFSVRAPKASEHVSLYDMARYAMCALRFQLEAEQRERDRANGEPVARLSLAFRDDGESDNEAASPVALAS